MMAEEKRDQSFKLWGLKDNPFTPLPPANEEERQQVFTGRRGEIIKLTNLVARPRGIFLVGLFGMGKSILALETLRLLNESGCITVYTKYDRHLGFVKSTLKKLAIECAKRDLDKVFGILVKGTDTPKKDKIELKDIDEAVYKIQSAMGTIEDIANLFREGEAKTAFVIVVDDLDKGTDIGDINEIIQDTRQLIELGCAVILPGHPFGVTAGFSSSADILYPLALEPLSEDELVEMMGKYLDLARENPKKETHPFSEKAARVIAKGIVEFELTPRIFNFACQLLLEQAAEEGLENIDHLFVSERWDKIAGDYLMRSLREVDKRYLKIIYQDQGFLSEDTREKIKGIGGEYAEYAQVRSILSKLIQENILIEGVEEGKRKMSPNPLLPMSEIIKIVR
jgi:hypothetical protein